MKEVRGGLAQTARARGSIEAPAAIALAFNASHDISQGRRASGLRPNAMPSVTAADALDDRTWFANHSECRFRVRSSDGGLWLIRRQPQGANPDVYLRTFARSAPPLGDNDGELAAAWYAAA
jgi:hypothetical protein